MGTGSSVTYYDASIHQFALFFPFLHELNIYLNVKILHQWTFFKVPPQTMGSNFVLLVFVGFYAMEVFP